MRKSRESCFELRCRKGRTQPGACRQKGSRPARPLGMLCFFQEDAAHVAATCSRSTPSPSAKDSSTCSQFVGSKRSLLAAPSPPPPLASASGE